MIAIAIPIFSSQLNAARVATDEANIRSGYALAVSEAMTDVTTADGTKWGLNKDGTLSAGAAGSYAMQGDNDDGVTIGSTSNLTWDPDDIVTYTYDKANSTVSITVSGTFGS